MQPIKGMLSTVISFSLVSFSGCAAVVPAELVRARAAYQHASASRAADLTPAELHKASEALVKAEAAWAGDPEGNRTADLSYVAERKAQLAEALAGIELSRRQEAAAGTSIEKSEHAIQKRTEGELTTTREQLAESERQSQTQNEALRQRAVRVVLLPVAQTRLDQVADALLTTKERNLTCRNGGPKRFAATWWDAVTRPIGSSPVASARAAP
jgi:Domain of unknown function (DUF4398)